MLYSSASYSSSSESKLKFLYYLPPSLPPSLPAWLSYTCICLYHGTCYACLCYAMLCYATLCFSMLCYAMLYYTMLCYAMLCYAMLVYRDDRSIACCMVGSVSSKVLLPLLIGYAMTHTQVLSIGSAVVLWCAMVCCGVLWCVCYNSSTSTAISSTSTCSTSVKLCLFHII
jgi:hypothetical protein